MIKNRPKLLMILHLPPPIHGAAMVGQYIKQSKLINNNFDCDYINLSTSRKIDDIGKNSFFKFFVFLKLYIKIITALIKNKYDLCYLTINSKGTGFYKEILIVAILKFFNKKIVYHYHNKGVSDNQNNKILNRLYKFQFKNSKAILLSPLLYFDIQKYITKNNVYYCPNGIPEIFFNTEKTKKVNNTIQLLFLSNMLISKGVYTLLKACKILNDKNIKFECNFIGDWTKEISKKDFNAKCKEYNLVNNVIAHGKKFGDDKKSFFINADIFIFPTFCDCFPLVLLEAMGNQLPVITTNEGAIPEIIEDGYNGYIVKKNKPAELADKIEFLINNPKLRIEMGQNGLKRYKEKYTLEKFEHNFVNTLQKVLNEAV